MFLFLFVSDFPLSVKKANYEFYEPVLHPRIIAFPFVHSILAVRKSGKRIRSSRLFSNSRPAWIWIDYNRNAEEGLHLTSIAAASMNIVYGFERAPVGRGTPFTCLAPQIPAIWKRYAFKINYRGKNIRVEVTKDEVKLSSDR